MSEKLIKSLFRVIKKSSPQYFVSQDLLCRLNADETFRETTPNSQTQTRYSHALIDTFPFDKLLHLLRDSCRRRAFFSFFISFFLFFYVYKTKDLTYSIVIL